MEKEIKVRKKRFAAFWAVVLLTCSLVVPMMAGAVDENGLVSLNEKLVIDTPVRAGVIHYRNADGETINSFYGGSGGWTNIAEYSESVPAGYTFSCWEVTAISAETTNSGEDYGNVDYPDNITLTPVFTLETYQITYALDGGTGTMVMEYTVETETFTLTEPTKTGYTFLGWTYDGQTEPVKTVSIEKGTTGDLSFSANWTVNQYSITFDTDGGTDISAIIQDYGTPITAPNDPTRGNDYFMGWDIAIPDTMPAENLTITAKWTPYVIDAGTYDMKQGVEYKLGSATKVSGDSSTYAGSSIFYVPADGSYTFS